jgi:hypothetical protein
MPRARRPKTSGADATAKLEPNEDARAVAARLTKELRLALRNAGGAPVNGFDKGKIQYSQKTWRGV